MKSIFQKLVLVSLGTTISALLANYYYVSISANRMTCSSQGKYIGVVMGTSPYTSSGYNNPFFLERLKIATTLYNEDLLEKIIVSGVSEPYYDEVGRMKQLLIDSGIPDSIIVIDSQGSRTWESVQFVLKHYKLHQIAFISQNFHAQRAVFLASQVGINACYFPMSNRITPMLFLRELLSRVKVHFDLLLWNLRTKRHLK